MKHQWWALFAVYPSRETLGLVSTSFLRGLRPACMKLAQFSPQVQRRVYPLSPSHVFVWGVLGTPACSPAQVKAFSRASCELCTRVRAHAYSTHNTFVRFSCGLDIETEADVASRLGVIYMSTMFVGVICLQTAIPAGVKERIVFYREQV